MAVLTCTLISSSNSYSAIVPYAGGRSEPFVYLIPVMTVLAATPEIPFIRPQPALAPPAGAVQSLSSTWSRSWPQ